MIETLKEDLQKLSETVPLVARKVEEATQAAEALQAAAEELQREVEAGRHEAASELTAVNEALPKLAMLAEAHRSTLKDSEKALLDAWRQSHPVLQRHGEAIEAHVETLDSRAHDLGAALVAAGTRIDQSQASGDAALAQLRKDAHEADERLKAALHALHEEVESFKQSTESAKQRLVDAVRGAVDSGDSAHPNTLWLWSSHLIALAHNIFPQEALDAMHMKASEAAGPARELFSNLGTHISEKVAEAENRSNSEVAGLVGNAEAQLSLEVERMGTGAGQQEEVLAKHREALGTALERMRGEADTINKGVAQIEDAAREAGV